MLWPIFRMTLYDVAPAWYLRGATHRIAMMRLSRWLSHSLAALLCALCLAAVPAASSWAAGQPLTQADLKPLAEDDFDAKVKTLNALAAAPAEQAGPILQALQNDALFFAPAAGMVAAADPDCPF